MKKINKLNIIALVFGLLVFGGCRTVKNNAGNYSFKTECLGSNLDGTQMVKAWGKGVNKKSALEQAKKNALNEILFEGLRKGSEECEKKPLISEVNSRSKYENYFQKFFEDGGNYSSFILIKKSKNNTQEFKTHEGYTTGITLKIKVSDLKQQLFDDRIIL